MYHKTVVPDQLQRFEKRFDNYLEHIVKTTNVSSYQVDGSD
jgi:hypothetical protein